MQWQPIETAPKDGQRVIIYCDHGVEIGWYEHKIKYGSVWTTECCENFGGYENPSHWMPLPIPPEI